MRRLHVHGRECVALFDDDNDLGMAALCKEGRRIAVSITHDSVRQVRGGFGVCVCLSMCVGGVGGGEMGLW
jgi:hypothetical protein